MMLNTGIFSLQCRYFILHYVYGTDRTGFIAIGDGFLFRRMTELVRYARIDGVILLSEGGTNVEQRIFIRVMSQAECYGCTVTVRTDGCHNLCRCNRIISQGM